MSGDGQPKKRKNKGRKKGHLEARRCEEYAEESSIFRKSYTTKDDVTEEMSSPTKSNVDEVIHVHKDTGLGGNVCTKLIFFCLLGALGVMVGFILLQYRGSSDADTKSAVDSPWSVMLEDWVETGPDDGHGLRGRESEEDAEEEASQEANEEEEEEEEEMFPEAIAALKQEKEEQERESKSKKTVIKEEAPEEDETEEEPEEAQEDEGTSGRTAAKPAEKEFVEEMFNPVEEEPVPTAIPIQSKPAFVSESVPEPPKVVESKPEEEEEEYDEEEEEEEVEDYRSQREIESELLKKNYEKLLAQFGQPTPESSDPEQSDDEPAAREYSDGGEESVGEESGGEVEGSEPDEPEEQKWTTIKKSEVATESEDEEEEEESEDEAPPVVVARRPAGGQKSVDDYDNADMTNSYDWEIREKLDNADEDLENYRTQVALAKFSELLKSHPQSPRARYGLAKVHDTEAEVKRSNTILAQAIEGYFHALSAPDVPNALLVKVASRAINRMRFRGQHLKAVPIHKKLMERFNDTPSYHNDLAISYLMVNKLAEAGLVFIDILKKWPKDPVALSHYGLVLKLQGNHKDSIPFLESGLKVDDPGTRDARLYFHLGDALTREGQTEKALKVYEQGVEKGLFRSKYQRSLYNVDKLTARPWWTKGQTSYTAFFRKLEENWKAIRDEGIKALKARGAFQDEAENLRDVGDWKQFELFSRGQRYADNCRKAPITCGLISEFEPARTCKRGQSKFSVMEAGTHVWPHCGPTNCRLRAHLGLVIPKGPAIRVANITKTWEEGKVIIFDDSFEHEVWHNGSLQRLVLIVDVWHPELTIQERASLSPI